MKIRSDFVSNSSSCSFVIDTNMERFTKVISVFSDIDIPYEFDNGIRVYVRSKNKNYNKLRQILIDMEYINGGNYTPISDDSVNQEPDDICWDSFHMGFQQLCNLPKEVYQYIDSVGFTSNDYGSGPLYLKMLYDFCDINDCEPNDEDTDRSFNYYDGTNSFYRLLSKKIDE